MRAALRRQRSPLQPPTQSSESRRRFSRRPMQDGAVGTAVANMAADGTSADGGAAVGAGALRLDLRLGSALALLPTTHTVARIMEPMPMCVMRRRVVINRWGHRVWRWVRVCY